MPSELMWPLASSSVLVVATGVGWQGRPRPKSVGAVLRRPLRWWLYDWWNRDRKRTEGPKR
jgi:hypothetical protein